MGLRSTVRQAVKDALIATGDIRVSTNYQSMTSGVYNASAGTQVTSYTTVAGVQVVFHDFEISEVDGQIVRSNDRRILMAATDVSGISPAAKDRVLTDVSIIWYVQNVDADPTESLWTLQVRK